MIYYIYYLTTLESLFCCEKIFMTHDIETFWRILDCSSKIVWMLFVSWLDLFGCSLAISVIDFAAKKFLFEFVWMLGGEAPDHPRTSLSPSK